MSMFSLFKSSRPEEKDSYKKILLAGSVGGFDLGQVLERVLADSLRLRWARPEVLICDGALAACFKLKPASLPSFDVQAGVSRKICEACQESGRKSISDLNIPLHSYKENLSEKQTHMANQISENLPFEDFETFTYEGLKIGEHAVAGALRFLARGNLRRDEKTEKIVRLYLLSSLLTAFVIENLLSKNSYEAVVVHHGIYVPMGIIGEVCRKLNVRFVAWNAAYRKGCFIFSHNETYHHSLVSEPVSSWKNMDWNKDKKKQLLEYLDSRATGKNDWISFGYSKDTSHYRQGELQNFDFSKPTALLLTSVVWDAKLHYKSNAFKSMKDWVISTIHYFSENPKMNLIVRVHPAEATGEIPSQQLIEAEIRKAFPNLAPNIFVVSPKSPVSTYSLIDKCNAALIYNTKTGMELSSRGIPVIVSGEAWIRGKGFSQDAETAEEYFEILQELPYKSGMSEEKLELAQKYAFHFFFRRMIPLPFIYSPKRFVFDSQLKNIKNLARGKYPGLDVICDGILEGKDFVFDGKN